MRTPIRWFAAAVLAALSFPAPAQGPQPTVRTGGVGVEERAALEAERDQFNLRVAFAETNGAYVSDVEVRILAGGGNVVYHGRTDGPWLFARIAPGTYRLEADFRGVTQTRTLRVGAAQSAPLIYMHWRGESR